MAKKLELVGALHAVVTDRNCPVSVPALCEALDKAPSTLYNELNPYPPPEWRHKLGLEDAADIMALTGAVCVLEIMAARLGYRLVDMAPAGPDKANLAEELLDDYPAIVDFHEAIRAGKPRAARAELLRRAIAELEEDFTASEAQEAPPLSEQLAAGVRKAV